MIQLIENQLAFSFPEALSAKKFDDPLTHRVSVMKAVDFVVEFTDYVLFVEVKDPDHTATPPAHLAAFREKLQSGKLENDLKYKFRDTLLYRWASDELDKPVKYVVLLQMGELTARSYNLWTDKLRRALPLHGPARWKRPLSVDAWVMNMATWNSHSPFGTVERVSP